MTSRVSNIVARPSNGEWSERRRCKAGHAMASRASVIVAMNIVSFVAVARALIDCVHVLNQHADMFTQSLQTLAQHLGAFGLCFQWLALHKNICPVHLANMHKHCAMQVTVSQRCGCCNCLCCMCWGFSTFETFFFPFTLIFAIFRKQHAPSSRMTLSQKHCHKQKF